jgi:hypothetical protein
MDSAEIIHDRLKKRLNALLRHDREYAVMKLERTLQNITLPAGFPPGASAVLEGLMESILETTNMSLKLYADGILTVLAEELAGNTAPEGP